MHTYVYILLEDTILRFDNGPLLAFLGRISVLEIPLRINYGA